MAIPAPLPNDFTVMSHSKPVTLFSVVRGPNPWKVEMLLNELNIAFETVFVDTAAGEHRSAEFTSKYSVNGRLPVLMDHTNNDFVIWESDAILLYIAERFDKEHKFTVESFNDRMLLNQWIIFQASGQGPYFGQAGWFKVVGPEEFRIPLAIERYQKEVLRVFGVLESVLSKQEWLVGGKYTIADLSFVIWNEIAAAHLVDDYNGFNFEKDFPALFKWHKTLTSRPAIAKALERRRLLNTK